MIQTLWYEFLINARIEKLINTIVRSIHTRIKSIADVTSSCNLQYVKTCDYVITKVQLAYLWLKNYFINLKLVINIRINHSGPSIIEKQMYKTILYLAEIATDRLSKNYSNNISSECY